MRIRFKPWARPELEAASFYIDNPEDCKGKWKEQFKNQTNPFYIELGCGKGNVILTRFDIERILLILNEQDNVDRIYINFCNPWPKGKHRKKRLTHTRQLEKYKVFLNKEHGEIHFKTDDDALFESSLIYFEESGFEIIRKTYDLHSENDWENVETEHEKMFTEQGIKIKALIAKLK